MKVKFYVSTGIVGSKREEIIDIPDDEVEDGYNSREDIIIEYFHEWLGQHSESGWYEVDA